MAAYDYFQAQNMLKQFSADDLADYESRFGGLQGLILNAGRDELGAARDASGRVQMAFSTMPGQLERRRRALGVTVGTDQQASETRRLSLQRAIADADASTRAIADQKDLRRTAQQAAFDMYADDLAQSTALTQGVAQTEAQREAAYQQAKAKRKKGLISLAGKIIGVAGAAFTGGGSLALTGVGG